MLEHARPKPVRGSLKRERVCEVCQARIPITRGRRFCSQRCRGIGLRKPLKPCKVCGKERRYYQGCSVVSTCSLKCGGELRKAKRRAQRQCNHCKRLYWPATHTIGPKKFCSRQCRDAERKDRGYGRFICANSKCGKEFSRQLGFINRRDRLVRLMFCSRPCSTAYYSGERSPLFRGDVDPNRGSRWRKLAESIRVRDGFACQRCGRTQLENGQKLAVDHIIPWRQFVNKEEANTSSNLVSLCKKCHGLKTTSFERKWLKGDVIAFEQYRRAVSRDCPEVRRALDP